MARVYTFVSVVDVEGETEDEARELLQEFFDTALESEIELEEDYQVLSYEVLSPATFVTEPDAYLEDEEEDDGFVDDVEAITTDPAANYE